MKQIRLKPGCRYLRLGAALLSLTMTACSFWSALPSADEQAVKLAETLEQGAYKSINRYSVESRREVWQHGQSELDVVLTSPTEHGNYPLIIYLPGLGESAEAGKVWQEHWAQAGYVVFSLQAVEAAKALQALETKFSEDDETENEPALRADEIDRELPEADERLKRAEDLHQRRSPTARNSELRYLGREYFSDSNLERRLAHLYWAYQQFKNRAAARQAPYVSADLSKVILAGYELGAQTVAAASGETFTIRRPENNGLEPAAVIVLSPAVDLATGNTRARFQALKPPMLVITGTRDNDPYAISSAAARTGIWEHAPAGNKLLLLLQDAGHRLLAGSESGGRFGRENARERMGGIFSSDTGWDGRSSGRSGSRRSSADSSFMSRGVIDAPFDRERPRPDLGYKHVAAVLSVSTAFLDLQSKHDEFAKSWLGDRANLWLGKAGSLKTK